MDGTDAEFNADVAQARAFCKREEQEFQRAMVALYDKALASVSNPALAVMYVSWNLTAFQSCLLAMVPEEHRTEVARSMAESVAQVQNTAADISDGMSRRHGRTA